MRKLFALGLLLSGSVAFGADPSTASGTQRIVGSAQIGGRWYNRMSDGSYQWCSECNGGPAPVAQYRSAAVSLVVTGVGGTTVRTTRGGPFFSRPRLFPRLFGCR